ncbi:hypothetical protein EDD36DRAFT_205036 [Exophiala viscosa]|uniref:Uncharacterized protein n=1 Tax=Exophiala viscosa TaxID=2486360 RepID=A0AAN6DWV0_9EURO|nr:hypothetical protein EDD36DRAFT_205036 [Exophiala viscosa]
MIVIVLRLFRAAAHLYSPSDARQLGGKRCTQLSRMSPKKPTGRAGYLKLSGVVPAFAGKTKMRLRSTFFPDQFTIVIVGVVDVAYCGGRTSSCSAKYSLFDIWPPILAVNSWSLTAERSEMVFLLSGTRSARNCQAESVSPSCQPRGWIGWQELQVRSLKRKRNVLWYVSCQLLWGLIAQVRTGVAAIRKIAVSVIHAVSKEDFRLTGRFIKDRHSAHLTLEAGDR